MEISGKRKKYQQEHAAKIAETKKACHNENKEEMSIDGK
jgi:hypothetical protein